MSNETCILTAKDFTILERLRDRCLGRDDPLAPLLTEKIESALVVIGDHVPANVATLGSRVMFSINGRDPDTRVLSTDRATAPVGFSLSVTTPRGLALLGLSEGNAFCLPGREGGGERVVLEKVQYQPEAAERDRQAMAGFSHPARRRPVLRLIRSAIVDQKEPMPIGSGGFDDPGPSAA
jgi:regulator of nucleoside diphosphate kinase